MAKDPAVLFYTSDFLTGTLTMSDEQVGKYIKLLCLQHQKGLLTEKDMLNICKTYDEDIFLKFVKTDEGYYNRRMKKEADKRRNYSESRRKNKLKTENSGDMTNICKSYDQHMTNISSSHDEHMENKIENRDRIKNVIIKGGMGGNDLSDELTPLEVGKAKEYIEITAQRKLTDNQITEYWKAYLIHSTGEFHLNRSKQLQHFRNWLKYQNNEKSKRNSKDAWKLDGSPDIEYDPL
jgi:hypothetical protein